MLLRILVKFYPFRPSWPSSSSQIYEITSFDGRND